MLKEISDVKSMAFLLALSVNHVSFGLIKLKGSFYHMSLFDAK